MRAFGLLPDSRGPEGMRLLGERRACAGLGLELTKEVGVRGRVRIAPTGRLGGKGVVLGCQFPIKLPSVSLTGHKDCTRRRGG